MRVRLGELTYDDLRQHPAWVAVDDYAEEEDAQLEPVKMDPSGRVPVSLEEVWCLCSARLADGSEYPACAMCRADSNDGPLLWTVWNGEEDVPLMVPPAPPPVLSKRGPEVFAKRFGRALDRVFPLTITVKARFAGAPEKRTVSIGVDGIEP